MNELKQQLRSDELANISSGSVSARLMCWLAAFPNAAYTRLGTASLKARVMANAVAVIVSPLVLTLALLSNGTALVGPSPYLYLLPVIVFAIERMLVASSYQQEGQTGLLALIRLLIVLISLSLAVFAALLSEADNLMQRLHRAEDARTLQSDEGQRLLQRLDAFNQRIATSEAELVSRPELKKELLIETASREKECGERTNFFDSTTQRHIKGGGCGPKAADHEANEKYLTARLDHLASLEQEVNRLREQRDLLASQVIQLKETNRSPAASLGSLARALEEADAALVIKIGVLALIVTVLEAAALILSKTAVADTLRLAVRLSDEVDQARLHALREVEMAHVSGIREFQRKQRTDALAPLDVRLIGLSVNDEPKHPKKVASKVEEVLHE